MGEYDTVWGMILIATCLVVLVPYDVESDYMRKIGELRPSA